MTTLRRSRHAVVADPVVEDAHAASRVGVRPVGRGPELAWLDGWWERTVRTSRAGRVLVTGPAGIGKSSVVDLFCDERVPGSEGGSATVLRLDGEPGASPGSTAARFAASLGLRSGGRDAVADLLRALGELQDAGPVLLVWEDLHWFDGMSAGVLARVLRRLRDDQVLTIATARTDELTAPWPSLFAESADAGARTLGGLDAEAVADVARTVRPVPWRAGALARLHEQTAGHPLHLVTLLRELPAEVLAGRAPFPAPRSLATEIGDVVARTAGPSRAALAALAVLNRPVDQALLERVVGAPREAMDRDAMDGALRALAGTGLVEARGPMSRPVLSIHHPLQAGAIREALGADERTAVHLAVAGVVAGREALTHRIAAADGRPDPGLAADLEASAAAEPVDHADAATRLLSAADVAATGVEVERLRLAAAVRLVQAYDVERLTALAPALRAAAPGAARALALGFLASLDDDPAAFEYQRAALDDDTAPPALRALAGIRLALENVVRGRGGPAEAAATAVAALTDRPHLREQALMHEVLGVTLRLGPAAGLERLGDAVDLAVGADLAITAGTLHLAAGQIVAARDRLQEGVDRARRGGASTSAHRGHVHLTEALFRCGRWDLAELQAEIALTWFADGDRGWAEAAAHAAAALVPAARGQTGPARRHLADAHAAWARSTNRQGRHAIALAEAVLARATSPDRMLAAIGDMPEIAARSGFVSATWAPWRPLYAEALLEAGRADDARRVVEEWPTAGEPLWFALARHRLEGRFASAAGDPAVAESWFRAGLALAGHDPAEVDDCPLEVAELQLSLGSLVAARGDVRSSRAPLQAARATFAGLGATAWVERADTVLITPVPVSRAASLTPRERQVTSCIVAGMTRREAAEALWVTPKAVDYHLRNAYAKLGISSRRELRTLSVSGTAVGGPG